MVKLGQICHFCKEREGWVYKSLPRGFAKKFPGHKNPANYAGKCYPHYPNVHLKLPVIKLVFFVDYWGKPNTYALFFAGHLKLFFVIDHWGN